MTGGELLFQKFETSAQEPVRLRLALEGFFRPDMEPEGKKKLEAYLKRRKRPVMEALMNADDLPRLQMLEDLGWLDAGLVDDGLEMAARLKKSEAFVWLLGLKAEKYGFPDKDFSL